MKKLFTILFFLLLFGSGTVAAQDENFLGLSLGAAFPQGTYAEKDYSNRQSGYANTGFLFTFDGALFPDDYLGIGATVTYGSNNPDKEKYKEDLRNDILGRYPVFEEIADDIVLDYGTWRYLNFHAGPCFTFPIGKLNIDLRALAGLSLVWLPEQSVYIELEDGTSFSRNVENKATPTIGFTAGGGLRYALSSGYVLRFITEYTNAKPTMEVSENFILELETGDDTEFSSNKVDVPLKNIHVGIGIAYNFDI